MEQNILLSPLTIKSMELNNRVFMAPMTRQRTAPDRSMLPIAETYYAQRASAGLIISEAMCVVPYGDGYGSMPEFVTENQVASWKKIVEAVHAAGGRIVAQLWNVGRARTAEQFAGDDHPFAATIHPLLPEDLSIEELEAIPKDFAIAAQKALEIGFDAVEIHAGNNLLLANFLREDVNHRTDDYGGTAAKRAHLLLNVVSAIVNAVGEDRLGLKLAPNSLFNGKFDPAARETFADLLPRLSEFSLAYLHVNRATTEDVAAGAGDPISFGWVREHYSGTLIAAESFSQEEAASAVADGILDAVVFGRLFIANPDLPARFAQGAPLNPPRRDTFYTNGDSGYVDYPLLTAEHTADCETT